MERDFDVVVVGAGVTGLAAALALTRAGVRRVAVSADWPAAGAGAADERTAWSETGAGAAATPAAGPGAAGRASDAAAGLALGGQVDNFTRVSHALGTEPGAALWRFGDAAFDALAQFCAAEHVPFVPGRRLRLVTSPTELTEAEQAVRELAAAGFASTLVDRAAHPLAGLLTDRVLAVQDDGPRAAWVDTEALLARLATLTATLPRLPPVRRLDSSGARLRLELAAPQAGGGGNGRRGDVATSEVCIVAAHLGTGALVPQLAATLVSVAEQWSDVALAGDAAGDAAVAAALTGFCFSANHTYEWGAFPPTAGRLALGGGRYLRPLAGFEATVATSETKIVSHLLQQLAKTFTFGAGARATATRAGLDIRPCDERPVIGPVAGESRVLVAAGYGGAGLTLGLLAGQCLAELVATGRSPRLPRSLLSPERFRSLES